VRLDDATRARRLATFNPGVMFGEMALLERQRRSADAFARGEHVVLYTLSAERFETLAHDDPALAIKVYRNLSRELAARLRITTGALRSLD
jgi:glutaminase